MRKMTRILLKGLAFAALALSALSAQARDWDMYDDFMTLHYEQGRIIDHTAQENFTTSEGQSYGMFFALVQGDQKRFDAMAAFVRDSLCGGDFGRQLPGWKFADGKLVDGNNATDSDLLIAFDLLEAARLWNHPSYREDALKILALLKRDCVFGNRHMGPLLLPGAHGFVHDDEVIINPSYFPPFVMQRICQEDPDFKGIFRAVMQAVVLGSGSGYVADFLSFNKLGHLMVKPSTVGSYDAIRFYLWLGITSRADPNRRILLPLYENMINRMLEERAVPTRISIYDGSVSGVGGTVFDAAMLTVTRGKIRDHLRTRLKSQKFSSYDYYAHVLTLFALGNDENRYALSADGSIIIGR